MRRLDNYSELFRAVCKETNENALQTRADAGVASRRVASSAAKGAF